MNFAGLATFEQCSEGLSEVVIHTPKLLCASTSCNVLPVRRVADTSSAEKKEDEEDEEDEEEEEEEEEEEDEEEEEEAEERST
nr:unnamed protein product [Spirometra erinaceieuropaei]